MSVESGPYAGPTNTGAPRPGAESDRWDLRVSAVWEALPYLLLGVSTAVSLLPVWHLPLPVPALLGLTLTTAAWIACLYSVRPDRRENLPLMGLYYVGLLALCAGLVALAPWFVIFAFVGYFHAGECLTGRWRYIGIAFTSMITAVAYLGGVTALANDGWWEWFALTPVVVVLALCGFFFVDQSERRNSERERMLGELHAANARLADALEENAALHARLLGHAREAGVRDERQRVAREIHDTLAQGLAGILTQLQAAEQDLAERPEARRRVANALELARESLTEARRTVRALEPEPLAAARLPEAIDAVARRWSRVTGIPAKLTTTGDPRPMHADVEVTLLRAAQEALANVAKHADAGRVGLTLSYMEDLVTLDVRDDGVGFEPAAVPTRTADGGYGLAGMRRRVQRLAGRLDIESEPGGGTAICAAVPAIPAAESR